jgi:hypothetical protein
VAGPNRENTVILRGDDVMMRKAWWLASLSLAAFIGPGCGGEGGDTAAPGTGEVTPGTTGTDTGTDVEATPAPEPSADAATDTEGGAEAAAAEVTLSEDEIANIEQLPAEDQALALAQKVCPSSDMPLGSMDVPIKVTVGDKSIFACCSGCEDDIKAHFDEYLAKLSTE